MSPFEFDVQRLSGKIEMGRAMSKKVALCLQMSRQVYVCRAFSKVFSGYKRDLTVVSSPPKVGYGQMYFGSFTSLLSLSFVVSSATGESMVSITVEALQDSHSKFGQHECKHRPCSSLGDGGRAATGGHAYQDCLSVGRMPQMLTVRSGLEVIMSSAAALVLISAMMDKSVPVFLSQLFCPLRKWQPVSLSPLYHEFDDYFGWIARRGEAIASKFGRQNCSCRAPTQEAHTGYLFDSCSLNGH